MRGSVGFTLIELIEVRGSVGFTLIELIVATSILIILTGMAIPLVRVTLKRERER